MEDGKGKVKEKHSRVAKRIAIVVLPPQRSSHRGTIMTLN